MKQILWKTLSLSLALAAPTLFGVARAPAADEPPVALSNQTPDLDVPYVPTPHIVVEKMLEMADVKKGEQVYDLGCGDGRIVVTAAKKFGARGIGIDLDPVRVQEARQNVKANDVENLVEIRQGNALEADVSKADVITLYLLPEVNLKLKPTLQKLKPGTRIVSHDFDMGDWKPKKTITMEEPGGMSHTLYLWVVGE